VQILATISPICSNIEEMEGCIVHGGKYAYQPLSQEIGKGGQAKVYKGMDISNNTEVAIKKIKVVPKSSHLIDREVSNIAKLSSLFIVKYLGEVYYEQVGEDWFAVLVMEYVGGGTLAAYLRTHVRVNEETAFKWMQQLVLGLSVAWDNDIVHRDIKPANILLTKPSPDGDIRICDFGISKNVKVDPAKTKIGTPKYMAPEIGPGDREYSLSVDIYSLGLVYLDLLLGMSMSREPNVVERLEHLRKSDFSEFPKKLIPKMVERNPNFRLQPAGTLPLFRYAVMGDGIRSTPMCTTYKVWDSSNSTMALLKRYNEPYEDSFKIESAIVSADKAEAGVISFIHSFHRSCFYELTLVLEDCKGGTLQQYIEKYGFVNELLAKRWLSSMLQTLQVLHRKGVVLRNLSPSNLVLDKDSLSAELKMCDFELAAMRIKKDGPYELGVDLDVCKENLAYRAPELLQNRPATTANDIWSLGCVFFYVLSGKTPFADEPCTVESVLQAQAKPLDTSFLSESCNKLLNGMLNPNDRHRFDTETCLSHPFFTLDPLQSLMKIPAGPKQRAVFQSFISEIRADLEGYHLNSAYMKATVAQQLWIQYCEKHAGDSSAEAQARVMQQMAYLQGTLKNVLRYFPSKDLTEETVAMAFLWLREVTAAGTAEEQRET